jgi:alpha-L-rhamnosidase
MKHSNMKYTHYYYIVLLFLTLKLSPLVYGAESGKPVELRCESKINPEGIDQRSPRLSWRIESAARGAAQTAYQIQISSDQERLSQGQADVWDSGKISSDAMGVELPAKVALVSEQRYWWQVRVWDDKGRELPMSTPATFLTGKMKPEDWKGEWIGPDLFLEPPHGLGKAEGFLCKTKTPNEPCSVIIDLGQTRLIDTIVVHPKRFRQGEYWKDGSMFPLRYKIEISDNDNLEPAETVYATGDMDEPNPGWKRCVFPVKHKRARFVRFVFEKLLVSWRAKDDFYGALGEIEVFSGQNNVALGTSVKATGGQPIKGVGAVESHGWAPGLLTDGKALAPKAEEKSRIEARRHQHGAIYLKKEFSIEKPVSRAVLGFSGLGYSECLINQVKVGDYLIGPGWTQYNKRTPYLTFDVTDRFKSTGKQSLDVVLADGWYALDSDPWGGFEYLTQIYMDIPKLRLNLRLIHPDKTETMIVSDKSWNWSRGEILRSTIVAEDIDLRKASQRDWKPVVAVTPPAGHLEHQKEDFNRVIERAKPISVTYDPKTQSATYSFGRELNGLLEFKTSGKLGQQVSIMSLPRGKNYPRVSKFWLAGTGEPEVYSPRFFYTAATDVIVRGVTAEPKLDDLVMRNLSSLATPVGDFKCSDEYLNWLHDATRRTMVNYTTFLPNDPTREYKAWVQDCQTQFWSYMYQFQESKPMFARWVDAMVDTQKDDGNVAEVAPGGKFNAFNSPWWGGMAIWMPWQYRLYTGDDRLIRAHYPAMKRYLEFLQTMAEQSGGLQDWGLLDWLPVEETPRELINTPAHYEYANILASSAEMLGKSEDAQRFREMAQQVRRKFNESFLDPTTGIYGKPGWKVKHGNWTGPVPLNSLHTEWWQGDRPCTQGGQIMALALGLVPEDPAVKAKVVDALLREIAAHKDHLSTGFVSTPYLLQQLTDLDPELCFKLVTQKDFPSWYSMTKGAGNDLLMETWAGGMAMMPALGGSVGHWFYAGLAGIRPDPSAPGFKKILIKPAVVSGIEWVECSYQSSFGKITSNWRKQKGKLIMDVTIPPNTTAQVFIPTKNIGSITESGKPAKSEAIRFLRMEGKTAVYEISSGHYEFKTVSQ